MIRLRSDINSSPRRLDGRCRPLTPHSPSPSPPPGEGSLEQPIRFRRFGYGLTGVASCNCSLGFAVLARGRRVRHPLTRVEVQRELGSDSNVHAKHTTGTPEGWWILDSDPNTRDVMQPPRARRVAWFAFSGSRSPSGITHTPTSLR